MKKVLRWCSIVILWIVDFECLICLFSLLADIPKLNYPRTAVVPMFELIFAISGLAILAHGLRTENKKRRIHGAFIASLSIPTLFIARRVNRGIIERGDTRQIGFGNMSTKETLIFLIVCAALVAGLILFSKFLRKIEDEWEQEKWNVVKTRFVKTDVRIETSTSSAVGRAIIGDIVAGPVGAMVGAATAKENDKSESTFIVFYKDGSSEVRTVRNHSDSYDLYMSRLER